LKRGLGRPQVGETRESLAALEVDGLAAARERGGERGLDGVEAGE